MVNALTITAGIVSFVSLVLVAIAMATNSWVLFETPRAASSVDVNPLVTNAELAGLRLVYDLDYFGLWVGCHREQTFDKVSCGFLSSSCTSSICWTRNARDKTCKREKVEAISNCTAFRVVRAFTIIGTISLIIGAAILLVSMCVTSRDLVWWGTGFTFMAGLGLLIAFAVFYNYVFVSSGMKQVANIGYSLVMLIVSWPLAIVGALIGTLAALSTPSKPYDYEEDSE